MGGSHWPASQPANIYLTVSQTGSRRRVVIVDCPSSKLEAAPGVFLEVVGGPSFRAATMAEFLGTPEVGDLAEFKKTIVASTEWEAFADLVVASERDAFLSADTPVESRPGPLTHGRLRAFVDALDLNERFGLKRTDNCVFAPLNPQLTAPEIEFELEDLPAHAMILMEARLPAQKGNALYESPKLVLECCDANSVPVITLLPDASVAGLFTLDSELSKTPGPAVPKATKDDLALVLHTSGTTKKPKIVPLTHGNIGHGVQFVARTLRRQPDDVCINIMPLFHIHGVIANIMVTLYSGSRVVCTRGFQGGDDFLDKLADDSLGPPTWYSAVPTMHEAILLAAEDRGSKGPWVHSLQMLRNCSAALLPPVSERFINAFGTKLKKEFTVVPTYAMTESFPICSNPPHLECKLSTGARDGPEIKILKGHPEDEEVAPGEEGEVCLLGRFKEIINRGGEKISPLEIEERLLKCDGVETCVCFAVPCELLGEVVGVALVCTAEVKAAAEALEADDHKLSRFLRKGEEKDWADPAAAVAAPRRSRT
ncbi:ligase [Aureococcus anophagefferens]|nr:ligase [Aureococcus anophagefferens]